MAIPLESLMKTGPDFDEPVDMLLACHDRIEGQCDTLVRLLPHLDQYGADTPAREAAAAVLRYFDTAGENHHQDEEVDLFPALREHAGEHLLEIEALVAALLMEHGRMRHAWAHQLRPELAAVVEGHARLTPASVNNFVGLYRQHVARENMELIPLARTLLSPAVLAALGARMARRRRAPVPPARAS